LHNPHLVEEYLARLGVRRCARPDDTSLRFLHAAHLRRVPFENLSVHLGEPIRLDVEGLADKILRRRRGGFCFELNGLFAQLLAALGFRVTPVAARVWDGDRFGPPLDHLALIVGCDDSAQSRLVDVGFGAHSLYPLALTPGVDQDDPGGTFRIELAGDGALDIWRDGILQYRVEAHPRELADFAGMCWYHQTSPRSHFTATTVCTSRPTRAG
jgi:N-hydroxyarylamine O-acetyltransferase